MIMTKVAAYNKNFNKSFSPPLHRFTTGQFRITRISIDMDVTNILLFLRN